MITYTLYVQQNDGDRIESKTHGSAIAALEEMNSQQAGGAKIHGILRNGRSIDEATLQADDAAERTFEVG